MRHVLAPSCSTRKRLLARNLLPPPPQVYTHTKRAHFACRTPSPVLAWSPMVEGTHDQRFAGVTRRKRAALAVKADVDIRTIEALLEGAEPRYRASVRAAKVLQDEGLLPRKAS